MEPICGRVLGALRVLRPALGRGMKAVTMELGSQTVSQPKLGSPPEEKAGKAEAQRF